MLKELNIKNIAIIDQLQVEFTPGLNVLTGETGAGKSIVVDALNLALGEHKMSFRGQPYLVHFVMLNFYFHCTTAYDILRHCGVEIGKRDFFGAIPMRMT